MTAPTPTLTSLSSVKLALMAKQARAQMGAIARAEPIAIIGMGCRLPGGVNSPEEFWRLLRDGVDAVGPIPPTRWDLAAFHDDDPAAPGKMAVRDGGFIDDVDQFDASFFGIMRREAERMDPQHRVFLEVAIEALERAGLSRESLGGSATGVFVASYHSDYNGMQFADRDWIDARTLTGTQHSVLANRLSYLLDLRGPSISVDTACSSSLVAVHLACQSLRTGESRVALAGGVSLMLSPEMMITLSKVGFMSPSGRCRTFDALADGFIRGEGCGVVVLKRLSDAISDGDQVLSVIRGTAVNQDGHSTVLAAPNGLAQQALVREALSNAQLSPDRVGFVETHGTATPLGDPIEVEALIATIGAPRADGGICYLGSSKANLGHLEAAAGVTGLIKTTLVLQHAEIPRQIHFTKLNPHLSLDGTCLAVADQHRAWPAGAMPRVAAISGFGVGGTNAHVLVEEAPYLPDEAVPDSNDAMLLPISAQSPVALRALATRWISYLETTATPLPVIAATAGERRSHYDHRLALTGSTVAQMVTQLRAFLDGDVASAASGHRPAGGTPQVAFVFSGQGPQWAGMGRELAAREPVFHDALAAIDARFRALSNLSVLDAINAPAETSRIMETEIAQPAIFAIQVALAALWEQWGVTPDAVVGHSIGELAALYVAGVLSLDDAVRIVHHRGRIMQRATGGGQMLAVGLTSDAAHAVANEVGAELSVAAINGPRSAVLSGTVTAIEAARVLLSARDVQHRDLPVSYAFHSVQMAPLQTELVSAIGTVVAQPARIAVYSSVTGARLERAQIDAAYFGRNVRETVRFAPAIDAMLTSGVGAFVELAPHPVLASALAECVADASLDVPVLASMRRTKGERDTMLQALGGVYVTGVMPDWREVLPLESTPAELPSYPWQRERYWLREFDRYGVKSGESASNVAPLLGVRVASGSPDVTLFDASWPVASLRWLTDHKIADQVVMPGAAMLELLRAAASDVANGAPVSVTDFVVHEPLVLHLGGESRATWQTVVHRDANGAQLELRALDATGDIAAARCVASARTETPSPVDAASADPLVSGHWQHDVEALYARLTTLGMQYGDAFRVIDLWRLGTDAAEGWVKRRAIAGRGVSVAGGVHPTMLDGVLQLCVLAISGGDDQLPGALLIPIGIDSYDVIGAVPERVRVEVKVSRDAISGAATAHAILLAEDGSVVAQVRGAHFAPVDTAALARFTRTDDDVYSIGWRRMSAPSEIAAGAAAGRWIVLTNGAEYGGSVIRALTAAGGIVSQIRTGHTTTSLRDGWSVVPSDGNSFDTALSALLAANNAPFRGVVHAWSADAATVVRGVDPDWLLTGSALRTLQVLARAQVVTPLWLVTQHALGANGAVTNPQQAGLMGLANVAVLEHPDIPCRVIDLDLGSAAAVGDSLLRELLRTGDLPQQVALRGDERHVPMLQRYRPSRARSASIPHDAKLARSDAGTLEELHWEPASVAAPGASEVRLRVVVAGVNLRDVLMSLGMYPGNDAVLGAECVGVIEAIGADVRNLKIGDRVFGFAPGSMATSVVVPSAFVAPLPAGVSDEQAAALPVAFLTAMFGLQQIAQISSGSRVLVHAAAGGVGLAAVQIVQRAGGEVFATAGSAAKREYLKSIGVQHVFDSRSVSFANDVLAATDGHGVDVVLNSLAGAFIAASVRCLATRGWLLELGKRDVWTPEQLRNVRQDVRYRVYDLGVEAQADPAIVRRMLVDLRSGLAYGALRALPTRTFEFAEATDAFRFMAQARHTGKLVLRAPQPASANAPLVRAVGTYLITGGTGAIGVRTARWLTAMGATSIVLTSRHVPGAESQAIIDACRAAGTMVHVRAVDAGDIEAMRALMLEITAEMPPLRGVVHAAGVVDDGLLLHNTWERWRAVLHGKAGGARVIDQLTQHLPVDFVVFYSSAGVHLGPIGQGAYAAANAELDAIASSRRARGLPALSVAWGQWPEAGMAMATQTRGAGSWSARGLGWIDPDRAFGQVERLLRDASSYAAIVPIQWQQFLSRTPTGLDRDFFRSVAPAARREPTAAVPTAASGEISVVDGWRAAPASEWKALVIKHVAGRARHVLGVDETFAIAPRVALKDVGLDSLMAVELRNVLTRSLGKSLPATLLFDYPSLDALSEFLLRTFGLVTAAAAPASPSEAPPPSAGSDSAIASLSDAEAEAMLISELNFLSSDRRR